MPASNPMRRIAIVWIVLVGGFAAGSMLLRGSALLTFADLARCLVPLFANACLLWNAGSQYRRRNSFWILLALGSTLFLAGQLVQTYNDLVLHGSGGQVILGDLIVFLHTVPLIAAPLLRPNVRKVGAALRYGYLDLLLLAFWWVYLYFFLVAPWNLVQPNHHMYMLRYHQVYLIENLVLLGVLAWQCATAEGGWKVLYGNLLGSALLYTSVFILSVPALAAGKYHRGSLFDLPVIASFVWLGTTGMIGYKLSPAPQAETARRRSARWTGVLAMIGVLSMPVLAAYEALFGTAPASVRSYRVLLTLGMMLVGTSLVFFRQYLVDRDRQRLLHRSEDSLENLRRLQTQFVQSEKLASLGQLAAGAAHEINTPLTAILGCAELLRGDDSAGGRAHGFADKIAEQARRTKTLVTHLLSFARQLPTEKSLLDLNTIAASAVQLRSLDLRDRNIRIELVSEAVLPSVRGDSNQLLQVFYNLISNAVDALSLAGGGLLTIRTLRERGNAVIEFVDNGPGIRDPALVFDPFYTTKPVGKGTGLGLSICYGIVREHGGEITCHNRAEGGAVFRVELPAVLALFPQASPVPASAVATEPS